MAKLYEGKGWPKGNKIQLRHGQTGTRAWLAWVEMKRRCFSKHRKEYKTHGARGITVCARWMKFEAFFADMGECPDGLQLDRIDNDGNYEHGNCRWATSVQQQNNRRGNVRVEIDGVIRTVAEWARLNGVRPRTAAQRLRAGWPARIAVSRESDKGKRCA